MPRCIVAYTRQDTQCHRVRGPQHRSRRHLVAHTVTNTPRLSATGAHYLVMPVRSSPPQVRASTTQARAPTPPVRVSTPQVRAFVTAGDESNNAVTENDPALARKVTSQRPLSPLTMTLRCSHYEYQRAMRCPCPPRSWPHSYAAAGIPLEPGARKASDPSEDDVGRATLYTFTTISCLLGPQDTRQAILPPHVSGELLTPLTAELQGV